MNHYSNATFINNNSSVHRDQASIETITLPNHKHHLTQSNRDYGNLLGQFGIIINSKNDYHP